MKTNKIFSNKYVSGSLLVIAGLLLGWLLFHNSGTNKDSENAAIHEHDESASEIWTCAMHPQIRMDKAVQCPICGMDLIPLGKASSEIDMQAIQMSESAMKLAEVQTTIVSKGLVSKDVLLYGKIQPNEKLLQTQTAHVPGRIEQLFINVTGERVSNGQLIAKIYSPELIIAQKELLEAVSLGNKYPAVLEAAREKLRNWKLSEKQIQEIESSGKISSTFDIFSNTSGIVTSRKVNEGDYVGTGTALFDVADLSSVWAVFDAYESDLPWIHLNQEVTFTSQAIPGKIFSGKISFIDPVVEPSTRIARVRAVISNPGLQLKPDMFINGKVESVKTQDKQQLYIPQSAVLWTGTRSVVYVKIPGTEEPAFKMKEITLGNSMQDTYVVLDGLEEGEEVVTNGTFSVDAAAQLAGKPSMMNPKAEKLSSGSMAGMDMGNSNQPSGNETGQMDMGKTDDNQKVNPEFKEQLTAVFSEYILMKNDFVASDMQKVKVASEMLAAKLKQVNMGLLSGNHHTEWMAFLESLNSALEKIAVADDIEIQRQGFADFNLTFYKVMKNFGLMNETVYYQYCPMAFDNRGAYWFSETKEIENPYFGKSMLKCGETRETFEF